MSDPDVFDSTDLSDEINDDEFDDEMGGVGRGDNSVDEEEERLIEEAKDANLADAMNKILASTVDEKENPVLAKRKLNYVEEKKERREKLREARAQRIEKKRIAELGHVLPSEDDKEAEKALRKIATKGVTALFNAIKRSQRMLPELEKANEKKKKKEKKMTSSDALNQNLEASKKKLAEASKPETKWSVLDENMVEKRADMQNWDTMEGAEDDWDAEMDE